MFAPKTLTSIAAAVAVAGSIDIAYAQAAAPAPYTAPSTDSGNVAQKTVYRKLAAAP